jgi:hypothetical protein
MPTYDKRLPRLNKRGFGRPTKRSKELEKTLLEAIADGAPFTLACSYAGITMETFITWRKRDIAFQAEVERVVAECALRRLRKIEKHGEENFAACCWLLERRHPEHFGRPEVQVNLIQQNNTVENHLTINITGTEATAIELQAQPVRDAVGEMFRQYRPIGNGEGRVHDVEVTPETEQHIAGIPIIEHRPGDERNQSFWRMLVRGDPGLPVAKETAIFAIRTLLTQVIGFKATRTRIDFADDPVTLGDLFDLLGKLGGAGGWQLAQKLGGY